MPTLAFFLTLQESHVESLTVNYSDVLCRYKDAPISPPTSRPPLNLQSNPPIEKQATYTRNITQMRHCRSRCPSRKLHPTLSITWSLAHAFLDPLSALLSDPLSLAQLSSYPPPHQISLPRPRRPPRRSSLWLHHLLNLNRRLRSSRSTHLQRLGVHLVHHPHRSPLQPLPKHRRPSDPCPPPFPLRAPPPAGRAHHHPPILPHPILQPLLKKSSPDQRGPSQR
jgi:hypothetical protein